MTSKQAAPIAGGAAGGGATSGTSAVGGTGASPGVPGAAADSDSVSSSVRLDTA